MFEKLTPDRVFESITDIKILDLKRMDIEGLILDIDNTIAKYSETVPPSAIVSWCGDIEKENIKIFLMSNNRSDERVRTVAQALSVEYMIHARKPRPAGFLWAAAVLNIDSGRICVIGDQIFTDVFGAKRAGMRAFLVTPRGLGDSILFRIRRWVETPFIYMSKRYDKFL